MSHDCLKKMYCCRLFLITCGLCLTIGGLLYANWTVYSRSGQSSFLPVAFHSLPVPIPERLLITEVLYNPAGSEPVCEWVEIYNSELHSIRLGGYKIGDAASPGSREGMLRFPTDAVIAPGEAKIVASQAACFTQTYQKMPDFEMDSGIPNGPAMEKYTAWATGNVDLSNTGDDVLILDEGDRVVDAVSWGNSISYLNPSARNVVKNHSLERSPAYRDTGTAADWIDQPLPSPWTVDLSTPTPRPSPTLANLTPTPGEPAKLLISEVLYDPLGAEPGGEWIEIFNSEKFPVSLSEYKIGDEETSAGNEGMFRFPAGAVLGAGQAAVIASSADDFHGVYGAWPNYELNESNVNIPNMEKYTVWATGSVDLANTGDEVLLLGPADARIDTLSWGNSKFAFDPSIHTIAPGHSLERWPAYQDSDSATDWIDQAVPVPGNVTLAIPTATRPFTPTFSPTPVDPLTPTLTLTPLATAPITETLTPTPTQPAATADHLVVSEVLYNPSGLEPSNEWIEIYNPTTATVDLSSFKIGNAESVLKTTEGMLQFPPGSTIASGQAIVIANQAYAFRSVYKFDPDYEMNDTNSGIPHLEKYTAWSSGTVELMNIGDEVLILDGSDTIVDLVAYGYSPFPGFQPPVPGIVEGHSIERYPASQDRDIAADWIDQAVPSPKVVY